MYPLLRIGRTDAVASRPQERGFFGKSNHAEEIRDDRGDQCSILFADKTCDLSFQPLIQISDLAFCRNSSR